MLTLVEVRGQGGTLSLSLTDPSLGYDIENIDGLDPVKATLVSSSFAQQDGAQYQSARREPRNIVMTLGLYPNYAADTVQTLRSRLYPFFMPKTPVNLRFFLESGLTVDIDGIVESMDAARFTSDPKIVVSIMNFDPDFYELSPVVVVGATVSDTTNMVVDYIGTVETGAEFAISVNRALSEFTIYHQTPDGTIKTMDFQASLVSGDILTINTNPGSKIATLTRAGVDSSILYGISPQSNWLEFETGVNFVRVYAEGAAIPYTLTYTRRYGGL